MNINCERSVLRSLILPFAVLLCSEGRSMTVSISVTHQDVCGYGGRIVGTIGGGTPPYLVLLSNGTSLNSASGTFVVESIAAGDYTVDVEDALLEAASAPFTITAYASFDPFTPVFAFPLPNCGEPTGSGLVYNSQGIYPDLPYNAAGVPPLTFNAPYTTLPSWDISGCWAAQYLVSFNGTAGTYPVVPYTDANGCPGSVNTFMVYPTILPQLDVLDVVGSCLQSATGTITVATTGGSLYECRLSFQILNSDGSLTAPDACEQAILSELPGVVRIDRIPPGDWILRVQAEHIIEPCGPWPGIAWDPICVADVPFNIPGIGPCAALSGNVFVDANANCTEQFAEYKVPDAIIELTPGPFFAATDRYGAYYTTVPTGSYTIDLIHPTVEAGCGATATPVAIGGSGVTRNIPTMSLVPMDVRVALSSGRARPGFPMNYAAYIRNQSPLESGVITVSMVLDPELQFTSAVPAPTTITGNTLTWELPSLSGFQDRTISIDVQVPASVDLLGTVLVSTSSVNTANTDGDLANNTAMAFSTITGSFDPNDKVAHTNTGNTALWSIGQDEWIDYTIRFQNTGTDTAFHVVLRDTLAAELDPSTLEMGAASHSFTWRMEGQGILKFFFVDIQLPDSNVNGPRSQGFVGFRIKPRQPVLPGTVLSNTANIYFDFNEPVVTGPSVLTAEFSTGLDELRTDGLSVFPVPTAGTLNIRTGPRPVRLTVRSIDGRSMEQRSWTSDAGQLDVSDYASGLYHLVVTYRDGTERAALFVR
ncbi:MAG: T9SS type A sorting domain-containing protein [Flavobacteriales bacterium]|nr:T9SS type A sorting domain-containing protein [Flavobacteriales bacterium]